MSYIQAHLKARFRFNSVNETVRLDGGFGRTAEVDGLNLQRPFMVHIRQTRGIRKAAFSTSFRAEGVTTVDAKPISSKNALSSPFY